ncbi:hypothetical protein M0813_22035 [Anaeramoeba flamelloides]|uniref:Homeobox domain-containing protein n=1 Tax=Anaeramoeba flamelloides TaxID=1746091 RepID=A0ABQ8YGA8_9EUKA|nr:hypothetical protein M0813_22035 [Anaeramoeba flamelloides]
MNLNNNFNTSNNNISNNNHYNLCSNKNGNNSLRKNFYQNNTTFCFSPANHNEKDPMFSTQQQQQNISSMLLTPLNFDNIDSDEYLPFQTLTPTLPKDCLTQMGNHDDLVYKNSFDHYNLYVDDKENKNNNFTIFSNKNSKSTNVIESETLNNKEKEPPNGFFVYGTDLKNFFKGFQPVNNTINIANTDSILDFQPLVMEDNKNVHQTFLNLDFHEQNNIIERAPKIKKKNINFSFLNLSKDLYFKNQNGLLTKSHNPIIKELKNRNQNNKYSMDQQLNLLKKYFLNQLEIYQNENFSQAKKEKEIKIILIMEELQKIKKWYNKNFHSINQAKNKYLNGVMNSPTPLEHLLQEKGGNSKIEEKIDNLFLLLNQATKKQIISILPYEMITEKKENEKQKENENENENFTHNGNDKEYSHNNESDHDYDYSNEYGKNQNTLLDIFEFGLGCKLKVEKILITRKCIDNHLNNNILNRKRTRSKLCREKNQQYLKSYKILTNNDNKLKSNLKNKRKHKKKIEKSNIINPESKIQKNEQKKMKKRCPNGELNHKKMGKKYEKKKLNKKEKEKEKEKIRNVFKLQNEQENNHKLKLKRRRRSKRLRTTDFARGVLEEWFQQYNQTKEGPYPKKSTRLLLAEKTQTPELQVQRWFGQRRRREKLKFINNQIPKPHWL